MCSLHSLEELLILLGLSKPSTSVRLRKEPNISCILYAFPKNYMMKNNFYYIYILGLKELRLSVIAPVHLPPMPPSHLVTVSGITLTNGHNKSTPEKQQLVKFLSPFHPPFNSPIWKTKHTHCCNFLLSFS